MTENQLRNAKVKCDIYSKVVGYCRKLDNFNDSKKQEFNDRKFLKLGNTGNTT